MKKLSLLVISLIIPISAYSQFDKKFSLNLSPGIFKTFGKKLTDYTGPLQFPNYKPGFAGDLGLQFKLGNHFSIVTEVGLMFTNGWNYKTQDKSDWLHWIIEDTTTHQVLSEGEDHFNMRNFSVCVKPKYYLLKDKKWNPYLFVGISLNWTKCKYEDNQWQAKKDLGVLPPDDPGPFNDYLHKNFGLGFNPGLGIEFSPKERFYFYAEVGYYSINLKDENFLAGPQWVENFNAIIFQAGMRFNFIRLKEL
ncbi:MAG: outer membrane beta-barrel protein [Bacteroidales bacterium]